MFTARYGLIPYIKQITFHLQKVNMCMPLSMRHCTKYSGIQFYSFMRLSDVLIVNFRPKLLSYCMHFDVNILDICHVRFNTDCNVQPRKSW